MDKVKQSTKNITPFGGLNFIYHAMNRMGLNKFLNEQIGFRSLWAKYSYSDVVYSLFGNTLLPENKYVVKSATKNALKMENRNA